MSRLLDFIAGAKALADQHESLKSEVLSDSTIGFVYNLLPYNILKDIVVKIERNPSMDGKFDYLYEALKKERDAIVCLMKISSREVSKFDTRKSLPPRNPTNSASPVKKHDCEISPQCRPGWDMFGCIKLYHKKTIDERLAFLKDKKCCLRCGSTFLTIHKCQWNGSKRQVRCVVSNCKYGAVVCKAHGSSTNASSQLKRWLVKNNVYPKGIVIKPSADKKVRFRTNYEVNGMEKNDVSTSDEKEDTPTNVLRSCATNCLDDCRSARDENPWKNPSAIDEDVPDAEVLDEDFSENVGNDDNSDDGMATISRGKPNSNVKCWSVKTKPNAVLSPTISSSRNLIKTEVKVVANDSKLKKFDGKCKSDLIDGDGLNIKKGVEEKKFDDQSSMTDAHLMEVTDDDFNDAPKNENYDRSNKFPHRKQIASQPSTQEVIDVLYAYASSSKDLQSCEIVPNMKYEELDEKVKLQMISKLVKSKMNVLLRYAAKTTSSSFTSAL